MTIRSARSDTACLAKKTLHFKFFSAVGYSANKILSAVGYNATRILSAVGYNARKSLALKVTALKKTFQKLNFLSAVGYYAKKF
jgi:hypothetical protein